MASNSYGSGDITLVAREATTSVPTPGVDSSVVIVGGYDANNADTSQFTVGETVEVNGQQQASTYFGDGSELHQQVRLVQANSADEIHCLPVSETTGTTESFSGTSSGTLSETPIDPNVNTEHDITAQDTSEGASADVNVVYESPPSSPSDANTINLNPVSQEWEADESSDYDITFDTATFDSAVATAAADVGARAIALCTEIEDRVSTFVSELEDRMDDFDLQLVGGGIAPRTTDPSTHSDTLSSERSFVVGPSRGTLDGSEVRTVGAVTAQVVSTPLGSSATGNAIGGLDDVTTEYSPSDADDFGSESGNAVGVLPLVSRDEIEIDEDLTTSEADKFRDIYRVEIIDEIAYSLHIIAENFRSEPNIPEEREQSLDVPMSIVLERASNSTPPLLHSASDGEPYTLSVSAGSNDEEAVVDAAIDVLGVAKTIDITMNVGPVGSNLAGVA